jgi:hypothetical protein
MKFTFSITKTLKDSWNIFARHVGFFLVLSFIMIIFVLFYSAHQANTPSGIILTIIVVIAMIMWGYVWISSALAAVDGKENLLSFRSLAMHMPSMRQFLMFTLITLTVGLISAIGFILLIIPGLYFLTRMLFATTSYVDRQGSFKQSLQYSWRLVKGKIFWTVLAVFLLIILTQVLLGYVSAFGYVGAFITSVAFFIVYPLSLLLITYLYRALSNYHRGLATAAPVQENEQ